MVGLKLHDIIGLIICWCGAAAVAYLVTDGLVQLCALASGYYLSKWIILKTTEDGDG